MRLTLSRLFLACACACLWPDLVHAHAAGVIVDGCNDRFNHPLHGWDHLLAMLAVGGWAARLPARTRLRNCLR